MVKIVCIAVFRHEGKSKRAVKLAEVEDLSGFSFFSRGKAREFITFGCRTTCERTPLGERVSVGCGYKDFVAHSMVRSDGLSGVAVTDEEYPKDMAYQVLYLILRDVNAKLKDKWKKVKQDSKVSPPFMVKYLKDYQEPTKMDKQGKVLKEIGELKLALVHAYIVLIQTLHSTLLTLNALSLSLSLSLSLTGRSNAFKGSSLSSFFLEEQR